MEKKIEIQDFLKKNASILAYYPFTNRTPTKKENTDSRDYLDVRIPLVDRSLAPTCRAHSLTSGPTSSAAETIT
jgi:hypothetical protein